MRLKTLITMALVCGAVSFASGNSSEEKVELKNVKVRIIEAEKFYRISEFLGGGENTGRRVILRTTPEERGGTYFILRFSKSIKKLPEDLDITLDFYEAGSTLLHSYRLPFPEERKGTNKLFLGVTCDTIEKKYPPVAWRLALEDSNGQVYTDIKSYLWEIPEDFED